MTKNFSNVMDYKVVADNGFQFNVNVYGINNHGNRKWMLRAVNVIRDYFTFDDDADNGLIINVVVNTHDIIVKAEFNGKKYFTFPIQPRYGKNQIKDILDNMGVVKDVIDVYTNNMVNNMNTEVKKDFDVLVWDFYNYVKDELNNRFHDDLENFVENYHMCADTENEYVFFTFDWDMDVENAWCEYAWEQGYRVDDAIDYYRANKDKFIDADDICEYMYELGDGYNVGIDDNCCGDCMVWVKNPCYVEQEQVENDSPCLDKVA